MSTRCVTHIYEGEKIICTMYGHSDGYPEGYGKELKDFLREKRVVNGLSGDYSKLANGAGCLAAQIVAHFKDGPGQIYIYAPGDEPGDIDYIYRVKVAGDPYSRPREGVVPAVEIEEAK